MVGGIGSIGGGVLPAILGGSDTTKQQVVTNFNVPDFLATGTTTNTNNRQVIRLTRYVGGDVLADLQVSLASIFCTSSGEQVGPAYTGRASFEIAGVLVPCTWNGSQTVDVASGASDIKSDPIQPSAFGMTYIPDQTPIYIKFERTYAVGVVPTYWYTGTITDQPNNFMVRGGDATTVTQVNTAGPLTSGNGYGSSVTSYFAPMAILGKFRKGQAVGTVIVGASIENGANDSPGTGMAGTGGYIRRGFAQGKYRAFICLAVGGDTAAQYLANRSRRLAYEAYGDAAITGFGGNDFSNGRTSAATIADFRTIHAGFKAKGTKVAPMRMMCKSDSTDLWASADGSNQTVRAGFIAFRQAIDDAMTADLSGGLIDMKMDCTSACETGTNTGLWKGTGTANAVTTDGTHPSGLRHGDMAVLLAPQADALINLAKAA